MQGHLVWYIAYIHQPPVLLPCLFLNTGLLCVKVVFQVRFGVRRVQEDFAEHTAIFLDECMSLLPSFWKNNSD